jgi:hypothetical protein
MYYSTNKTIELKELSIKHLGGIKHLAQYPLKLLQLV